MKIQMRKAQQGFTLIELVVVIVILGILAVTAAPKFINLQDDARTATLNAVKASMQSAATLVYSKALIAGEEAKETSTVNVNGNSEPIAYGYPRSNDAAALTSWGNLLDIDTTNDFALITVGTSVVVHPVGKTPPSAVSDTQSATNNCYAYYTESTGTGTPVVITPHNINVVDCL